MTPDQTAAKEIAGYYNDHDEGNIASIAAAIRDAYEAREAKVAELVRCARMLVACYSSGEFVRQATEAAIKGVEGT